jgi:histone H3/H4
MFLQRRREQPERMAALIIKSAVKEAFDDHSVAADFYEALDGEVTEFIDEATQRAEANDRKTVHPRDL